MIVLFHPAGRPLICLDACCIINLAATGRMEEILSNIPARFGAAVNVTGDRDTKGEALAVWKGGAGPDRNEKEPFSLQLLVESGLLTVMRLQTDDEKASFVAFSAADDIDAGEAMTCALAQHRGGAVASDDSAVPGALRRLAPGVALYTTSQLIKWWAETRELAPAELGKALRDIQERGHYVPRRSDPLRQWWLSAVNR